MFSLKAKNEYAIRLLEVAEVLCGIDGQMYGQKLREIFEVVERGAVPERQPVLDEALEKVLLFIKQSRIIYKVCLLSKVLTGYLIYRRSDVRNRMCDGTDWSYD